MDKTDIHPDEVLEALLAKGPRSNKAATLKSLHEICRNQYQHQSQSASMLNFGLSTIGRICEACGLFKARVLYNAASKDYVALITAWAAFSGTMSVKAPKEPKKLSSHQYLMRIEDPAIRSLMQSTIAERDDLLAKVNLLKSRMQITIDQRPLGATIATHSPPVAILEAKAQLTESERESLEKAISKEFLDQEEWREGSHGEITNRTGRTLYDVGYVTAIRKILGMTS